MSCDYAVWHTPTPISPDEAQALYSRPCEEDISGVAPHAGIAAFYAELAKMHPQIDDVAEDEIEDDDLCPWSCAFDKSDGHVIMCSRWSKADYVDGLVSGLAAKHGLGFFDPQSDTYVDPANRSRRTPWWRFW